MGSAVRHCRASTAGPIASNDTLSTPAFAVRDISIVQRAPTVACGLE
jgi:hypothetical protein